MESLATTVSSGYNVAINNTDSWTAILKAGSDAAFGVSSYTNISNAKLLPDWNYCLSNSMCQNQCCSNVYSSTDGRLKCTPGTNVCNAADVLASQTNSNGSTTATTTKTISSPSTAATSTMSSNAAVTPWLTDWSVCSANNQCLAGCCSNVYSSGSYKCTPNAGPNDCMGSVSSSSGGASSSSSTAAPTSGSSDLGAWQFCSTSSQCSNGCCSSQYSTSDGKLKCTPGGTICV